ncbi:unnamed protein product [Somion occarium]|uniref:homogentisate 1,2-dioxygenase n=1 Tax=Somion occarium TaxID=3059160 RepID=A0ABP1EB50_9APHY
MSITTGATAKTAYLESTGEKDPYKYQVGFGNWFATEAIPGVLPSQSHPQKTKYDLYTEGVTGWAFTAPRAENKQTWLYRIQPSVSHDGFTVGKQNPYLVSDFTSANPHVHINPTQVAWSPIDLPSKSEKVDFIEGLKTLGGIGSSRLRDGLATHFYAANSSMQKKAFVNSDGDILIFPDTGRLDIQTEMGRLMVRPGELVVIPGGIKFKVSLPDGPSRGFVQEIYSTHFVLPEPGPLGSSSLAKVRDFEHPVASFDIDQSNWEIVYKIGGQLFTCKQDHTPFDVVAWNGNYAPYKYALEKFIVVRNANKDHADPSSLCVLTAKSKIPNQPLVDICVIAPHWDVTDAYRGPYFHRNTAAELVGIVAARGDGGWRPGFVPGSLTYQSGFAPHGSPTDEHKMFVEAKLVPTRAFEDTYGFVIEPVSTLLLTDWALKAPQFREQNVGLWKGLKPAFLEHIDQVNADLKAAGLPILGQDN